MAFAAGYMLHETRRAAGSLGKQGIRSAIAERVAERGRPSRFRQMFVRRVPKSGRGPDAVLSHLSLAAAADIQRAAESVVAGDPVRQS